MRWFTNMKIAPKLIAGFTAVALIAGVVGLAGIVNMNSLNEKDTLLYTHMTVPLSQAADMSNLVQQLRVSTRDLILESDTTEIEKQAAEITRLNGLLDQSAREFEKTILSDDVKQVYADYMDAKIKYRGYLDQLIERSKANDDAGALAVLRGGMKEPAQNQEKALSRLVELKTDSARVTSDANSDTARNAMWLMFGIVAAGMALAVGMGILIARSISKPINRIVEVAGSIAAGNLDVELDIRSRDEVGILAEAFRNMTDNINDVLTNINASAEQVASGSEQVSATSMALSQGATEQASSIEELTASLEEISSQTNQNASHAGEANQLALTAKEDAESGNGQMRDMLKAMEVINDSSVNISKIIKVIDEIAFQTNILALNAAVEAARAGQHGKGFAVVAEEVRNLAARSANAAKETTDLIEGSIRKVEGGTRIAHDTAEALNKIVGGITKVAGLVNHIAEASHDQASAIGQVAEGLNQVSQVTQTNSAASEESAAASQELSGQAEALKEQVERFTLKKRVPSVFSQGTEEWPPEVARMLEQLSARRRTGKTAGGRRKPDWMNGPMLDDAEPDFGKY